MREDWYGSAIAVETDDALADWNNMTRAFLAHDASLPDHLNALLAAAPDLVAAHAARGLFCLFLARRELIAPARAAHDKATELLAAAGGTPRDRALVGALGAWLDHRPRAAVAEFERILDANPRDSFAMKLSHGLRFILGDADGMLRSVCRSLEAHEASHPCRGFVLGCKAFALEETGQYAAAERAGRAGLETAPQDAWGLHAVAHVHDMTARSREGILLLDGHAEHWAHCNNFRYHVWWHKALMHIDQGETAAALQLYDGKIRIDKTDDYRDIANATSLLMRLDLEGVDTGDRWSELAELAETRSADGCLVFADLHYMLALIGDHRDSATAQLAATMATASHTPATPDLAPAANAGAAAAQGLAAFSEGRYAAAFAALNSAIPRLQAIGGSHAQRDVFERITIDAGIRAGHLARSVELLDARRARRRGHEDRFNASRMHRIAAAQQQLREIPAHSQRFAV